MLILRQRFNLEPKEAERDAFCIVHTRQSDKRDTYQFDIFYILPVTRRRDPYIGQVQFIKPLELTEFR